MQAVHQKTQCIYCNIWWDTKQCIHCCTQMDSNSRYCLCICWRWWCISEQRVFPVRSAAPRESPNYITFRVAVFHTLHSTNLLCVLPIEYLVSISHSNAPLSPFLWLAVCFCLRFSYARQWDYAMRDDQMSTGPVTAPFKYNFELIFKDWRLINTDTFIYTLLVDLMRGFPAAHHRKGVVPFLKNKKINTTSPNKSLKFYEICHQPSDHELTLPQISLLGETLINIKQMIHWCMKPWQLKQLFHLIYRFNVAFPHQSYPPITTTLFS